MQGHYVSHANFFEPPEFPNFAIRKTNERQFIVRLRYTINYLIAKVTNAWQTLAERQSFLLPRLLSKVSPVAHKYL